MVNLFPILWMSPVAYFILRLWIGVALWYLARQHLSHWTEIATPSGQPFFSWRAGLVQGLILSEAVLGGMFIAGWLTQAAALGLLAMSTTMLIWRNRLDHPLIPSKMVYFLFLGGSLSLLITGAGIMAFDLPI